MGTVIDIMPLGDLLDITTCGLLLSDRALEQTTVMVLEGLGEDVNWWNRHGESNNFPDMEVRRQQVDCKGSAKYFGSMFIGIETFSRMIHRRTFGQIYFILNDLSVVTWDEFEKLKVRKDAGWAMSSVGRSIKEWLEEIG